MRALDVERVRYGFKSEDEILTSTKPSARTSEQPTYREVVPLMPKMPWKMGYANDEGSCGGRELG